MATATLQELTMTLPVRKVEHFTNGYAVVQKIGPAKWDRISKFYTHSTSAFAALGRFSHEEVKKQNVGL